MTDRQKPRQPPGLGTSGRRLWRQMVAEFVFRADELVVLEHACRAADDADRLADELKSAPLMVPGSAGQPVANPALRELRETRTQLARLLALLDVPDSDASSSPWDNLTASQRARKAAMVRWKRGA